MASTHPPLAAAPILPHLSPSLCFLIRAPWAPEIERRGNGGIRRARWLRNSRRRLPGDDSAAATATRAALRGSTFGADQDVIVPALTEVGRRFEPGSVPAERSLPAKGQGPFGLLRRWCRAAAGADARGHHPGTAMGDIHDIGKNIVGRLFKAHGFKVIDLGKDVPAARFLKPQRRTRPTSLRPGTDEHHARRPPRRGRPDA